MFSLLRGTTVDSSAARGSVGVRSSREGQVGLARLAGMVGGKGEMPMRRRSRAKSMSGWGGDDRLLFVVAIDISESESEGDDAGEEAVVDAGVACKVYWGHWGWWDVWG
jgi:hypothetical protein